MTVPPIMGVSRRTGVSNRTRPMIAYGHGRPIENQHLVDRTPSLARW